MGIFDEAIARKPDYYPWTQGFIEAMWAGHWTSTEFSFQSDIHEFKVELTEEERGIITRTLSAIGQIEISVKTFWARLGDTLPHPSIIDMGLTMANVEVIHNKAYEKLLDVLQLQGVFEDNLKLDIIQGRVKYLKKYLKRIYRNNHKQFLYSIILFTLYIEYVSLFSQFYVVLNFNRFKNVLKDTAQQVQYTKNEELLHSLAGIEIIKAIRKENPELFDEELEQRVLSEAQEAFASEAKIIDWILGGYESEGLNDTLLKEYTKNRFNWCLEQIGFGAAFEVDENILDKTNWMDEETYANTATDFFHKKPVEYSKNINVDVDDLF